MRNISSLGTLSLLRQVTLIDFEYLSYFYYYYSRIYSLHNFSLTMKILTQSLPLEDLFVISSESQVYHFLVVENRRPELPVDIPPSLADLISRAWDSDASRRPSADEVVQLLETLYLDECAEI
jgi:hypothetical protein